MKNESLVSVGTQYLACLLSMLLVFTSITPVQAHKLVKPGTARKALQLKIDIKIPRGTVPSVNIRYLSPDALAKLDRQVLTAAGQQIPAVVTINGIQYVNDIPFPMHPELEKLLASKPEVGPEQFSAQVELEKFSVEIKNFVQMYDRVKQLLMLGTPQTKAQAKVLIKQMVEKAQEVVKTSKQIATEPLIYVTEVEDFLNDLEQILKVDGEMTLAEQEQLYQRGREFYDKIFPNYTFKGANGANLEPNFDKKIEAKGVKQEQSYQQRSESSYRQRGSGYQGSSSSGQGISLGDGCMITTITIAVMGFLGWFLINMSRILGWMP